MGIYTTPTQLRLAQRDRFKKVGTAQTAVHKELATTGQKDFIEATGGGVKTKTLRAMGHPFGRLGGTGGGRGIQKDPKRFKGSGITGQVTTKGVLRPLPINVQSGRLRRAIRLDGPKGTGQVYNLYSAVPYAKFVLSPTGTRKMVARGLLGPTGHLRKRHKARLAALVDVIREIQKRP